MTMDSPTYREERQAQQILGYVTEVDGPEDGPIYRQIRDTAKNYVRHLDRGDSSRERRIEGVKNGIVPEIVAAMNRRWPGELKGQVSNLAKTVAAERIYDEVVTMEMATIYEEQGRPVPSMRRMPIDTRPLSERPERKKLPPIYTGPVGKEPQVWIYGGMTPPGGVRPSERRMPGSVLDIPVKTLGHAVEARMNAAAKRAGLLGRR
jgi:hypothetical protein